MYRLQEKTCFIDRCMDARSGGAPEEVPESETFNDSLFFERPPRLKHPSSLSPEDRGEYLHWLGTFEALFTPAPECWVFGEIGSFGQT
jgi:hypothetical protein